MCIPMPENKALKEYKKNTNNNDNYFNSVNSLQFNDAFKNKLKEVTADDKLSENEVSTVLCTLVSPTQAATCFASQLIC